MPKINTLDSPAPRNARHHSSTRLSPRALPAPLLRMRGMEGWRDGGGILIRLSISPGEGEGHGTIGVGITCLDSVRCLRLTKSASRQQVRSTSGCPRPKSPGHWLLTGLEAAAETGAWRTQGSDLLGSDAIGWNVYPKRSLSQETTKIELNRHGLQSPSSSQYY